MQKVISVRWHYVRPFVLRQNNQTLVFSYFVTSELQEEKSWHFLRVKESEKYFLLSFTVPGIILDSFPFIGHASSGEYTIFVFSAYDRTNDSET